MTILHGPTRATGHYLRRRLRTADYAWRFSAFAALLLVVALAAFRFGSITLQTLYGSLATAAVLAVLAALLAVVTIARAWHRGDVGAGRAIAALFMATLVSLPFAGAVILYESSAGGNLATTEGFAEPDPVRTREAGAPAASAGTATLPGRRFAASAAQVFAAVRTIVADKGWTLQEVSTARPINPPPMPLPGALGVDPARHGLIPIPLPDPREEADGAAGGPAPDEPPESAEYTLHVLARDFVLKLPSEVTIHIAESDGEALLDMRAQSQVAPYDLGQNRRFIEDILARLDIALAGIQGAPAADE
ncbi:DUF1499 domain-containing protein [Mangrovibrevibacter kandeliae]|uniref:DUF1499 domain-containing protein n=1 Tax=Mangrovibrevibacter kandeliae TaxID=2968473 RepID=UPI0021184F5A|nr:DUF1499 domain-containing protein [Aurantimonas sp. CSK15Z-1]MCQ8780752.1 DUF1499 domain-containing protein [Aurantimonas sp. CSK15Z-1]